MQTKTNKLHEWKVQKGWSLEKVEMVESPSLKIFKNQMGKFLNNLPNIWVGSDFSFFVSYFAKYSLLHPPS